MDAIGDAELAGEAVHDRREILFERIVPANQEPHIGQFPRDLTRSTQEGEWVLLPIEPPKPSDQGCGCG